MAVLKADGRFENLADRETVEAAIEKLQQTKKGDLKDLKAKVFFAPTLEVLIDFCQQDVRFARAVLKEDKNLVDCLAGIAKGVGSACSDLDVYRKAVQYWLSDAEISMQLSIYFTSEEKTDDATKTGFARSAMVLNLLDF